ncbi:MAG: T9SS type A sorting domain-containing protein [Ignavibacteria bacterium]
MRHITNILVTIAILVLTLGSVSAQETTIDQKVALITNSVQVGGEFIIEYQVKGSNLSTLTTLASLNADLVYDSSAIRFVGSSNWLPNLSTDNGYSKSVTNNYNSEWATKSIRIFVAGSNVNNDNSGTVKGYDLPSSFTSVVRLNFIILDITKTVTISVKTMTNQTGLFASLHNSPNTFDINNITLSDPINITEAPLPVTLMNFTHSLNGNNVKLSWMTSSESNNKGFEIQRKSITDGNWKTIGFVEGAGNSNSEKRYSFDDKKLNTGKYQYRMKQVDYNGNFSYNNLNSEITMGLPKKFNLSQNYPNPFNPSTKIDYELPTDSKVKVIIYDALGREVRTLVNEDQKAGLYTIDFNAKDLSSGFYFYRLISNASGNELIITKKMTYIK